MKTALILKKMAAIVAIVGAGLLAAPLEQAQAQTGIPEVTELCILANGADPTLTSGWKDCHVNWDVSSILSAPLGWQLGAAWPSRGPFYDPPEADDDGRTTYGTMLFYRVNPATLKIIKDEWIQIFFYFGIESGEDPDVSAWVEDSDGNEYTIDVRIILK